MCVVWDRYSVPRYRFMIDDNSFFLRDIAQKGYKSLFDCFYLKGLRELHRKYGTRFCLNIYYVAADDVKFPTDADFRLPQFPIGTKASGATMPIGSGWPSMRTPTCRTGRIQTRRRRS